MTKALYQLNLRLNVTSETTASRSCYSDLSYSKAIAELRGAKYCISTPYDTPHLLSVHRAFLANIGGSFHVPDLQDTQPTPLPQADICIMDVVSRMLASTPEAQATFNRVRIYFGFMYLSEIVTVEGSYIARDAWEGGRMRLPPFLWPYQPRLGPKSFRH
jgi:hypothetical protein